MRCLNGKKRTYVDRNVREVKESIEAIGKIGISKRAAREDGNSGIHLKKQKENTMSDCQNFVKWARSEHGVKSIADLNEDRGYIVHLSEKGISEGHRINVETSLRKNCIRFPHYNNRRLIRQKL